ncbi:16S rRNA (guanine(966)-N(2))-methyltransferase RsmD [Desulfothermobacter acidiphilus]|uniref:16S rRNA (guanine(966)-N(2))-methyltransferase RsmD n=1 Tax=Desulfothermobacter acidiphilus TaxID=1938353 RepID=UPI003F8ACA9A
MRITGGSAKRCRLASPKGKKTRPTSERVKGALFNILAPYLSGAHFLDLFAGTGGIGIEALSRGAERAVLVEKDPQALRLLRENLQRSGLSERAEVRGGDVLRLLPRIARGEQRFDIIFLDPPYARGYEAKVLRLLVQEGLVQRNGWVIVESSARELPPDRVEQLVLRRRERYGDTALSFYTLEEDSTCA